MGLVAGPPSADVLKGIVHYLVDTPEGSVGILDDWRRDERGRPESLIVAQGWFGRRRLDVPVGDVREIDHEGRRIVLFRGAAPLEPERSLRRLTELARSRSRSLVPAHLGGGRSLRA